MPLYDYECQNCGLITDIWANMKDEYLQCPKCCKIMSRIITRVNFIGDYNIMGEWDHIINNKPIFFGSKQDKKRYLADNGLAIKGDTLITSQKYQEEKAKKEEEWSNKKRFTDASLRKTF